MSRLLAKGARLGRGFRVTSHDPPAVRGMITVAVAHEATGRPGIARVLAEAGAPAGLERARQEIASLAAVRHPGIAPLLDAGILDDGRSYVVHEDPGGVSLLETLATQGPLTSDKAARLMTQVLDALAYGHRLGVVHRALDARSLRFVDGGLRRSAVITGLGLLSWAEAVGDRPGGSLEALGDLATPTTVLAPQRQAAAGDIHAWGRVLLEALGAQWTDGAMLAPVLPKALRGHFLAEVGMRAISPDPRDAYQTAAQVFGSVSGRSAVSRIDMPRSSRVPSFRGEDSVEQLHARLVRYTAQEQWPEAIEMLERLAELSDGERAAMHCFNAALIVRDQLGDGERAQSYFLRATEHSPSAHRAIAGFVAHAEEVQDWRGLEAFFQRLAGRLEEEGDRGDELFRAWRRLGTLYRDRLGDRTRAREVFARALALFPGDTEAKALLASVAD